MDVSGFFDAMGRLTRTTNPDGTYSNTVYSDWDNYHYDERGTRNDYAHDAYGRVWRVREYSGYDGRSSLYPVSSYSVYAATHYTYDSEGNLKTVVDTASNTTTINYDNLGRKTSMTDPDMGMWSYTYDLNGNLKTQTDAKAQVITFTYDALNRLKTKVSGTALNVTYTYDDTVNSGYAKGRLSKVDYVGGSTKFVYDLLGRETQSVKTIDGTSYTVRRVYDNLNNVTRLTYPDLSEVHYQYNSVGQLQAISNSLSVMPPLVINDVSPQTMFAQLKEKVRGFLISWAEPNILGVQTAEAAVPATLFVKTIDYNAMGQATRIEYGNGTITTQTFNSPMFRLNRIYTIKGALVLQDLNYTYDTIGNIRTITDAKNTADQTFTYDHRNRLTQAVGQGYGTLNYSYSALGNIAVKEGVTYTYSKINSGPHAVTSLSDGTTLSYDLNGNMSTIVKTGDSKAFTYDVENRLMDVKKNGSTIAQYFMDGDGGRTAKISYTTGQAGNNTCFLAGTKVLMEDGRWTNIERIKVGDRVASYDEKKMAKTSAKVTKMFDGEMAKEYLLINGHLKVTPNHQFYSQGEWTEIGTLKIGDFLLNEEGNEVTIDKIEKIASQNPVQVYNLEVEGEHNYFVAVSVTSATSQLRGVLVHNKLSYNPPVVSGVPVTSGVITHYIGSLFETTKGVGVNHIFLGSTKIATIASDQVRYHFQDHLGSANVVTDSAGSMIELAEYKPFGEFSRREQYGTTNAAWYYFTGKPLDDETGLMFYGARYYSPILGRFITPDTIVQAPLNPQTLNRYSYCNNNPVNLIDPDGHSWISKLVKKINEFFKDTFQSLEERTNSKWSVDVQVGQTHQFQDAKTFSQSTARVGWATMTQPWQIGIGIVRWAHDPRFRILKTMYDPQGGPIEESYIEDGDHVFINGMQNNEVYAIQNANKVYATKVAFNPPDGALADLTESLLQKMLFTSSIDRQLAGELVGHKGIVLTGHSQGAIIAANTVLNLGLSGNAGVVKRIDYRNTQITQFRAYVSAVIGGVNKANITYGSRYFDFSNALGPNLQPSKFVSGLIGLTYLPLGMDHHGIY